MKARSRTLLAAAAAVAASALALSGCSSGSGSSSSNSNPLIVGTTDKIVSLDPAAGFDYGSMGVYYQVYAELLGQEPGTGKVVNSLAKSAEFATPTDYRVILKPGLKFSNGDPINAEAVKFSFDRVTKINSATGPAYLLQDLKEVTTTGDDQIDFTLKTANNQTWPYILTSSAGAIVDPKVFPADKVMQDKDVVKAKAWDGPYMITSYTKNSLIRYQSNPDYAGLGGKAKTSTVVGQYFASESDMKLSLQKGTIDVAYRSFTPSDVAALKKNSKLKEVTGPGGELRFLVFNLATMPYGTKSSDPDAAKALAVRQAIADLIDRKQLAKNAYQDTYTPVYGNLPDGMLGASDPLKTMYGDGSGGPDKDKAAQTLKAAGITQPVTLNIEYNTDHYGSASTTEYALIKDQLESSGLFKVNLQTMDWESYVQKYPKDGFQIFQLGVFPYSGDSDDYLTSFFGPDNSFLSNHYSSSQMNALLAKEIVESDSDQRALTIKEVLSLAAKDLPILDLLQGQQIAFAQKDVKGITLDASFRFRYALLSK